MKLKLVSTQLLNIKNTAIVKNIVFSISSLKIDYKLRLVSNLLTICLFSTKDWRTVMHSSWVFPFLRNKRVKIITYSTESNHTVIIIPWFYKIIIEFINFTRLLNSTNCTVRSSLTYFYIVTNITALCCLRGINYWKQTTGYEQSYEKQNNVDIKFVK